MYCVVCTQYHQQNTSVQTSVKTLGKNATAEPLATTAATTTTIVFRPFDRDYPGEPVPEETLTHPPS